MSDDRRDGLMCWHIFVIFDSSLLFFTFINFDMTFYFLYTWVVMFCCYGDRVHVTNACKVWFSFTEEFSLKSPAWPLTPQLIGVYLLRLQQAMGILLLQCDLTSVRHDAHPQCILFVLLNKRKQPYLCHHLYLYTCVYIILNGFFRPAAWGIMSGFAFSSSSSALRWAGSQQLNGAL